MSESEWAVVLEQKRLTEDIFCLQLKTKAAQAARPGQFVNLYMADQAHLLPRPISVCDAKDDRLTLAYRIVGEGTKWFSGLQTGDKVRLLGPLGNGYDLEKLSSYKQIAVVGGGLGIPPMLYLAKELFGRGAKEEIVLGYRNEAFLLEEFQAIVGKDRQIPVYTASDSGTVGMKGTVLDVIKKNGLEPACMCACGPLPMLRALKAYCMEQGIELFVSLEERMACGIGACLGCVCTTVDVDEHSRVHNKRVCKDGPVFAAREVDL